MNSFRSITLAAMLAAAPFAAGAGQAGGSDGGTHIYSPSPLITHMAAVPHDRGENAVRQEPVRIASADSVGTSIYQPGPLTTVTRQERVIAGINAAYGTRFAVPSGNVAVAMNNR
jgi:hypothetical protein